MQRDLDLTDHFKVGEFLVSDTFPNIAAKMNFTQAELVNYYHLTATTLEPERQTSGHITKITQGKRSGDLHESLLTVPGISPSPTSQHLCRHPFDAAIDFQKVVYKIIDGKKEIDIVRSRVATIRAFFWIKEHCLHSFGLMYYTCPAEDFKLGYVHLGSVTPGERSGVHTIIYPKEK